MKTPKRTLLGALRGHCSDIQGQNFIFKGATTFKELALPGKFLRDTLNPSRSES